MDQFLCCYLKKEFVLTICQWLKYINHFGIVMYVTYEDNIARLFQKNLPLFNALGDSTRQQLILLMMDSKPRSVIELAEQITLSRPAVSHHLKVLRDANIVTEHKEGRRTYYKPHLGDYFVSIKELVDVVDELVHKEGDSNG